MTPGSQYSFEDLMATYEEYEKKHGISALDLLSDILSKAKNMHREAYLHRKPDGDADQSWRAFKGKNTEKLIEMILRRELSKHNISIINGNRLERSKKENLKDDEQEIQELLSIDYGDYGKHLPDVDLIVYRPSSENTEIVLLAVISVKITLRERVAQTGYWRLKMKEKNNSVKIFLVTLDEDEALTKFREHTPKGKAIAATDTDIVYVIAPNFKSDDPNIRPFQEIFQYLFH